MTIFIKIFQGYRTAISHFLSIAKKEIFLKIFVLIAFISQIIIGLDYFDNVPIAIGYSIVNFLSFSIAYALTYYNTENKSDNFKIKKINIQLVIIGFIIVIHFISICGQFPDSYLIKITTQPIRTLLYEPILNLGFSGTVNQIIMNIIICVIVPTLLIFLISRQKSGYYINGINLKILFLLLILYLPIILSGYKPLNKIISDLPYYLFIAAIPEEILFRGFLQSRLEKIFKNPTNGILLSSLIFGFMHLPINIGVYGEVTGFAACIGNNAFGGLFIGYLFYRTRSVWTIIIYHLISGIAFI